MKDTRPKLYLESPYFNDEQKSVVHTLEELCDRAGYDVYSPFRDGITLVPNATDEDRRRVLDENCSAIQSCRIVVAATDGESILTALSKEEYDILFNLLQTQGTIGAKILNILMRIINRDPGTNWELGFAYALNKPIFTFSNRGFPINVMIGESVVGHTTTYDELSWAIQKYLPFTREYATPDENMTKTIAEIRLQLKKEYKVF